MCTAELYQRPQDVQSGGRSLDVHLTRGAREQHHTPDHEVYVLLPELRTTQADHLVDAEQQLITYVLESLEQTGEHGHQVLQVGASLGLQCAYYPHQSFERKFVVGDQ